MITVIVVIHLLIAIVMIGLILLQKTEGNAAGGGFAASSSLSNMMQPRARANPLSRATQILGFAFFGTSLGLALLAKETGGPPRSILSDAPVESGAAPRVDEIRPESPASTTPATAAPAADAPAAPPAVPQVPNN